MAVHVLCALACGSNAVHNIDAMYARLYEQASRIALNRTVAGLHFPLDSHAGELLGRKLAEYLLARSGFCRAGGQPTGLNVEQFDANDTKSHVDYLQHKPSKSYADYLASLPPLPTANWAIEPVAWLFEQAAHEWA